jgi:putative GTP pyrophosphokinase
VIIEYPIQLAGGSKRVLAEIQVRTLAMNFWATIEHSLNYKYKESLPEELRTRLKKAAEAAFVLDEEMSSIREEIMAAQKHFEDKSNLVSRVLNGIQELYMNHQLREAARFQLKFNELWEKEDVMELKLLDESIQRSLANLEKKKRK